MIGFSMEPTDHSAPRPGAAYRPRRTSRSQFVYLRGLACHVRVWGEPDDPPLLLLHGGRDASATFQFLVDALAGEWRAVAPDWRGHGRSGRAASPYAFSDYLADLDALLPALFGGRPVPIVGHSLGGNVACVYAGLRPERLTHLVSLDGFGVPERSSADAPDRLVRWLDSLAQDYPERLYPDLAAMAERLAAANPQLPADKALFMAEHLSRPAAGGFVWALDPAHRRPFAAPHRVAEWEACLRRIAAPTLWLGSGATFPPALDEEPGGLARRAALARAELRRIPGTGHNLHHDAPDAVAREIEEFLGRA